MAKGIIKEFSRPSSLSTDTKKTSAVWAHYRRQTWIRPFLLWGAHSKHLYKRMIIIQFGKPIFWYKLNYFIIEIPLFSDSNEIKNSFFLIIVQSKVDSPRRVGRTLESYNISTDKSYYYWSLLIMIIIITGSINWHILCVKLFSKSFGIITSLMVTKPKCVRYCLFSHFTGKKT